MLKSIVSFLCLFLMSFSLVYANPPHSEGPPRGDYLDSSSPFAQLKLQRAEHLLTTLGVNPQDYHLILSSNTCFGGEAVPPHVFSDKPTMILYQGALSPNRSNEEVAFMMAHELGHLHLHHMEKMNAKMDEIFNGSPTGISGAVTFSIFQQKFQEREADLYGLQLYKKAGYSIAFFPHTLSLLKINPNIHFGSSKIFGQQATSLSMKDSHFCMKERFELLVAESVKA